MISIISSTIIALVFYFICKRREKEAYAEGYSKGVQDSRDVEHIQVFTSVQDLANYLTQERH